MTNDNRLRIDALKTQAKRLRADLRDRGSELSHSQSLELIARQHGARDWNTLVAQTSPAPARSNNSVPDAPVFVGQRVSGRYLGQPFSGRVLGLTELVSSGQHRITLHFDVPVDVVTFASFSALRQRVSGIIDRTGQSPSRTSNGVPHLMIQVGANSGAGYSDPDVDEISAR
ncbi:glyoxalase superfamily protein [Fodinicurvata sp. EGI_FJ10296]|uniref:glyoxalase superfamily protein n=1 Tax=Fodinicurvata sp. EGI_FJ10296 TaxID=3231908 RepID=UPI003454D826